MPKNHTLIQLLNLLFIRLFLQKIAQNSHNAFKLLTEFKIRKVQNEKSMTDIATTVIVNIYPNFK